jgi:mono/diheme cytochrome c family protein
MWVPALVVGLTLLVGACAGESAPEVPEGADGTADPVLVEGREIWQANCTRCHGGAGGGGAGPSLKGPWTPDRSPDLDTMLATVREGRGAMPRFGSSLSDEEIESVVRYVREVL